MSRRPASNAAPSLRDSRLNAASGHVARSSSTISSTVDNVQRADVERHGDHAGDRVRRPGVHLDPAHGADGAGAGAGGLVDRQHEPGGGQQRVAPVLHAGGAGVVRLALELDPPALARREHVGDAQREVAVGQRAALLDVHLEEAAHPLELLAAAGQRVAA